MNQLKNIYRKIRRSLKKTNIALFGNRDYQKFVIISRSRTGSTLLMALLRSHPNIHVEGELFKVLNGKSCKQIWDELYDKHPARIKQVGFKLFYYHPFDDDQSVWDYLLEDKNISIIHLRRENMLRALVSQKIGEKTKQWTQHINAKGSADKVIQLDPEECRTTFENISAYEERTRQQFARHKTYVECTYERLAADGYNLANELYAQFDLPAHKPTTVLKKQNPESMQDLVSNYEEVKEHFSTTKWAYLFD